MASNFRFAQLQPFLLAGAGQVIGSTTIVLQSMLDINGNALSMATDFGSIGYGTLEPGNGTLEEQISFSGLTNNGDGTVTLSGVNSVAFVYPYTETSGLSKTHAGASTFVISNTSGFYNKFVAKDDDGTISETLTFTQPNFPQMDGIGTAPTLPAQLVTKHYVDSAVIAGAPNASATTIGITKLSINPASPTSPIAIGSNDGSTVNSLLTASGVGSVITTVSGNAPSSGNALIDADAMPIALSGATQGDILYNNGANWVPLAVGTSGQFLKTQGAGANPQWAAAPTPFLGLFSCGEVGSKSSTGTQTIAHGLGVTPKMVRIHATNTYQIFSHGSYNGTTASYTAAGIGISLSPGVVGVAGGTGLIVYIFTNYSGGVGSIGSFASIAVDATNITLTWTAGGSSFAGGGTPMEWEAEA